jgi:hypothetical protein
MLPFQDWNKPLNFPTTIPGFALLMQRFSGAAEILPQAAMIGA